MRLKDIIKNKYSESAEYIKKIIPETPKIAIVAGSGVFDSIKDYKKILSIPYSQIPNFYNSTIEGHSNSLVYAIIADVPSLIFTGRFHLYEGFSILQNIAPVAIASLLGIEKLALTNAAGGLGINANTGDIMIIDDLINLSFRSIYNELQLSDKQIRREIFSEEWRKRVKQELIESKIGFIEGAYQMVMGPNYETPAEIRAYRKLGATAIGMSTIFEAQAAQMLGMETIACSIITNKLCEPYALNVSHEEVLKAAQKGSLSISSFIKVACKCA